MAYNTDPFHGKTARVEKNDVVVSFTDGWSIDVSLDMADTTSQGDNWKKAIPGTAGATGSFSGHFVAGNTEQKAFFDNIVSATPGTKLTDVKFLLDSSTNAFVGNIYITGLSVPTNVGDKVSFTVNFQVDDALSLTDAA